MDLQRSLPKIDCYFVITMLYHLNARSMQFFLFLLLFKLRIASFTEVRFTFKQFIFMDSVSPSGPTFRVPPKGFTLGSQLRVPP